MMEYDGDLHVPKQYLVAPPQIDDTVGERMAHAQKRHSPFLKPKKFGHVTYFFNGNKSEALLSKRQVELPSFNVPFDQKTRDECTGHLHPEKKYVKKVEKGSYDLIRLNLANGDMVRTPR